jgi:hypothetical protein
MKKDQIQKAKEIRNKSYFSKISKYVGQKINWGGERKIIGIVQKPNLYRKGQNLTYFQLKSVENKDVIERRASKVINRIQSEKMKHHADIFNHLKERIEQIISKRVEAYEDQIEELNSQIRNLNEVIQKGIQVEKELKNEIEYLKDSQIQYANGSDGSLFAKFKKFVFKG